MSRQYSDPSYGGHQQVTFPVCDLLTCTNAGEAAWGSIRFMFPCKVIAFNVECVGPATDYTEMTGFVLSHRLSGATGCTVFGTADMLGDTATHSEGDVISGYATGGTSTDMSMEFNVGDDCVLEVEGTGTQGGLFQVNLEVEESFQEGDS